LAGCHLAAIVRALSAVVRDLAGVGRDLAGVVRLCPLVGNLGKFVGLCPKRQGTESQIIPFFYGPRSSAGKSSWNTNSH
jgi:hypothetical protein